MKDQNTHTIVGRLGKDADTKTIASGSTVTNFSVATEDRWLDSATKEWKGATTWHDVTVWGAEPHIAQLQKGQRVMVSGPVNSREYTDKDGVKRVVRYIKATSVEILFVPERQPRQDAAPPQGNSRMGGTPQGAQRGSGAPSGGSAPPRDWSDDVPFSLILLAPIAGYLAQFVGV